MKYQEDNEILQTFVVETRDHLEVIEFGILKLEETIGQETDRSIDELFRAAHSIKAGANLLGFKNIEGIAHALEDVLHSLRIEKLHLNDGIVNAILNGIDMLAEMIGNVQLSEMVKIDTIIKELATLTE